MIYHPFLQMGGKINKDQRVQKPFNVNLTIPKTERHSEKPWFSKLTSEEIILDLRTRSNIWRITMGDSKTTQQNKWQSDNVQNPKFRTEIKMTQPN